MIVVLLLSAIIQPLMASDNLLFVEAQMVGGYSSSIDEVILYSHHFHEAMQKPSVGFDFVKRFGNESRDWGLLAIQYRVAYQQDSKPRYASQLYNAYYKQKLPGLDVWIGSNKPAVGLTSNLDNHAVLLSDMSMKVFTFDRDWGVGAEKDMDWLKLSGSATNGSGMQIYNKHGNYLLAGRMGLGNLNKSNYNLGFSAAHGKVLEAMGYTLGHPDAQSGEYILHGMDYVGMDGSLRYLNIDLKFDSLLGEFYNKPAKAIMLRTGIHLLEEERLTLEAQVIYSKYVVFENFNGELAAAYKLNSDFTLRAMGDYDTRQETYKIIGQLYYYKPLGL
jgi:hypothetical protein